MVKTKWPPRAFAEAFGSLFWATYTKPEDINGRMLVFNY
jgi:hypothetical protein